MALLEERVALVTGAGGGIGRAAALLFAREGALLTIADVDGAALAETARLVEADGYAVRAREADISHAEDVAALVDAVVSEHGRLDCAFNNAGISGPLRPIVDYPAEDFHRVLAVNVQGLFHCLHHELPVITDGTGAIVNTSSGLGVLGSPALSAYVASKHAVMGLTKTAALEVAARGVRVNALLPGIVDTSMPARLADQMPGLMDVFIAQTPFGRLARPEEVAEAAAWLCSVRSSFVTGHGLVIDGGIVAQ